MRKGYFGIGVENISKGMNLGNLARSTHAFGGSFFFTINANYTAAELRKSDTTHAVHNMPHYDFASREGLLLPKGCQVVGVELTEDSIELPSFRHPKCAAYILGPERGSITPETQDMCDFIIKIPTQFCINLAVAGAIVMYDRVQSMGNYPERPVRPGGPEFFEEEHAFGPPLWVKRQRQRARR